MQKERIILTILSFLFELVSFFDIRNNIRFQLLIWL